jgi:hypothetical protein
VREGEGIGEFRRLVTDGCMTMAMASLAEGDQRGRSGPCHGLDVIGNCLHLSEAARVRLSRQPAACALGLPNAFLSRDARHASHARHAARPHPHYHPLRVSLASERARTRSASSQLPHSRIPKPGTACPGDFARRQSRKVVDDI